jgi:hypothetical protein
MRDSLVGALDRHWHIDTERLRGFEVDDQLDLGGLLDGQVRRSGAVEDLAGRTGCLPS